MVIIIIVNIVTVRISFIRIINGIIIIILFVLLSFVFIIISFRPVSAESAGLPQMPGRPRRSRLRVQQIKPVGENCGWWWYMRFIFMNIFSYWWWSL